jgi:hypothetical protein
VPRRAAASEPADPRRCSPGQGFVGRPTWQRRRCARGARPEATVAEPHEDHRSRPCDEKAGLYAPIAPENMCAKHWNCCGAMRRYILRRISTVTMARVRGWRAIVCSRPHQLWNKYMNPDANNVVTTPPSLRRGSRRVTLPLRRRCCVSRPTRLSVGEAQSGCQRRCAHHYWL